MIWVLLFSLIFGKPYDALNIPKLKKEVRRYVEDKERRDQILDLTNDYKIEAKQINKYIRQYLKNFKRLNKQHHSTAEEFHSYSDSLMLDWHSIFQAEHEARVKFREIFKEEEWNNIINDFRVKHPKEEKKREKQYARFEKFLDRMEQKTTKVISEKGRANKAISVIQEYRENAIPRLKAFDDINIIDNDILSNFHSSPSELREIALRKRKLRKEIYDITIDARVRYASFATEDEWKKIVRFMNRNIF